MTEPGHHLLNALHAWPFGQGRAQDHDHGNTKLARGVDLGARAKIDAARELGLPVIMIARPALPERPRVESVEDVLAWLGHDARLGA